MLEKISEIELNENANNDNIKAAIELLLLLKKTKGKNYCKLHIGEIHSCKLCNSLNMFTYNSRNCTNCILCGKDWDIYIGLGCDDINWLIEEAMYIDKAKEKRSFLKKIRKILPQFIEICKKRNVKIPKGIINY